MNPENAIATLEAGAKVLNATDVKWWLSCGTALGLWRDGLSDKFLEHDTDIDVHVLGQDSYEKILPLFYDTFNAVNTLRYDGNTMRLWGSIKEEINDTAFDIYFYEHVDDEYVCPTPYGTQHYKAEWFNPTRDVMFKGKWYPLPDPPHEYLEHRYGKDWRTPTTTKVPWHKAIKCLRKESLGRTLELGLPTTKATRDEL